jgi:phage terminase large subunit
MSTRLANRNRAARAASRSAVEKTIQLQLPAKLSFLLEQHPYKIAYGGRGSLKSWSFARALLVLGVHQPLRILCARETQKSLAQSVHQLLRDQIEALDLGNHYVVTENAIKGTKQDTLFRFTGLSDQTIESIKSFERFDIAWIEEAQAVSRRSFQILLPTIFRTKGAEVWVSFNPAMDTDEVWERFVVHPPEGAVVAEMNWRDTVECGWWTPEMERLRQYDLVHSKNEYENIWEGRPSAVVAGAIYTSEITELVKEGRSRPLPYDPRLPVHVTFDLGWNDAMTAVMVQKPHPSVINIIGYLEDSRLTYAQMLAAMDRLNYKWGTFWLPHDAEAHHPTSGTNAKRIFQDLGCKVQIIPRSDPEARIKAARMMFSRVYIDNSKHDTPPERPDRLLGAGHLLDRLRRYKRSIPTTTGEPASPVHDSASHGSDAFGYLAEIVDRIRNDNELPRADVRPFRNPDSSMGLLG